MFDLSPFIMCGETWTCEKNPMKLFSLDSVLVFSVEIIFHDNKEKPKNWNGANRKIKYYHSSVVGGAIVIVSIYRVYILTPSICFLSNKSFMHEACFKDHGHHRKYEKINKTE